MIRRYRDILMVGGLFLAVAAWLILLPAENTSEQASATSHSSRDEGTLALYRWLDDLGYHVERLEYRDFAPDATSDLLFVLGPTTSYTPDEATAVLRWVAAGGTLILADDEPFGGASALLAALDVTLERVSDPLDDPVALGQPVAPAPAINAATSLVLGQLPSAAAPLIGAVDAPILAGLQHGSGYIYLSSALRPFTNAGLADAGSPALLLSLLRRAPLGGRLVFDEYHHGFVEMPSLGKLLRSSPWGWALIYAGLVSAAYIVLSGRRFGRPRPLREETARRSSAEYLQSMAGLLHRGHKSGFLLDHYRVSLKRRLARPYGISPSLDDAAFVAALASVRPIDTAALRGLLARLNRPQVSEAEVLRIIGEADRFEC
ncbi:MAG: DUF4350 domain-containing protein [Oscillochloris sp.]|nr:DUF4350 domain-containing protein [Oscillochloris sp.]